MATRLRDLFPFGDIDRTVVDAAAARFPGLPADHLASGFELAKAIVDLLETMASALDEADLSPGRWRLLTALALQSDEDGATIGELAQHLGVREPTVTATVDRLEDEGLVARHRSEADRRVVNVKLTDAGQQTVFTLLPYLARRIYTFVEELGGPEKTSEIAGDLVGAATAIDSV